jgi:hypothetical protein
MENGIRAHYDITKPWSCGWFGMMNEYKPGYMLFYCIIIQLLYPAFHVIFFGFGTWLKTLYSIGKGCEKQCGGIIWVLMCTVMLPWEILILELVMLITVLSLICGFAWSLCRLFRVCSRL